jgi:hypothetical protein
LNCELYAPTMRSFASLLVRSSTRRTRVRMSAVSKGVRERSKKDRPRRLGDCGTAGLGIGRVEFDAGVHFAQ